MFDEQMVTQQKENLRVHSSLYSPDSLQLLRLITG